MYICLSVKSVNNRIPGDPGLTPSVGRVSYYIVIITKQNKPIFKLSNAECSGRPGLI